MTKILKSVTVVLLALLSLPAHAEEVEIDGIRYNLQTIMEDLVETKIATVLGANSTGDVVIPKSVVFENDTYAVTGIGIFIFEGDGDLTSVVIPESVTFIAAFAFYGHRSLTSIVIPESVTYIGNNAFVGCSGLTSIAIPESVTSIGNCAFLGCSGLTSIDIPKGVTSIGDEAFQYCSGLTSINIPSSVTSIGNCAFQGCSGLTSIDIPNSVTYIGYGAFEGCSSLTSIDIPSSVTSIGHKAFNNCERLISLKVAEENTKYHSNKECTAIIETATNALIFTVGNTIPEGVTSIADRAFANCGLTSIVIPEGVTSIGNYAFADNYTYLKSVVIPSSVTSIGEGAFQKNWEMHLAVAEGNEKYDSRDNCDAIIETATNTLIVGGTYTIIPNSVTSIGDRAFYGNGFESGVIPEGVTSIGDYGLYSCGNMTSVVIPSSVTSIGEEAFSASQALVSLKVAEGNEKYDSRDDCNAIIETATNTLIRGCCNTVIPEGVTSIANRAFAECAYRDEDINIVSKLEEPFEIPEYSWPFDGMWGGTLTVPYGTKDAYIAAGWDIFPGNIVEEGVVELDENSWETPIEQENATAHVKRSINADEWSTIVLPFDMTEEQVKEAFGDNVQLADFAGYETIGNAGEVSCIQVNFNAANSIKANTPCLIKVGMDISEFTVEGVNVVPEENLVVEAVPSTESQWSKMVGSYVAGTQIEKNCLFLSGNKFWYSTGDTRMKGYRAYFDFSDILSSVENAEARVRLAISGDGTTTGVESVEFGARKEAGSWYSLDGHRLTDKPTEKGIYIVDGKKVAID